MTGQLKYYIDFAGGIDFTGIYDDITSFVKSANWNIGMHAPYQETGDETRLNLVLDNRDKRFSPEYTDSPLFGNFLPQRRIKVEGVLDGVTYPLYFGYIDSIKPAPMAGTTCAVTGSGAKQYMQNQLVRVPLMENVRSDEVLEALISSLSLPPQLVDSWILGLPGHSELGTTTYLADISVATNLDVGDTTFRYVADNWDADFHGNQFTSGDWQTGFKGYEAIHDVVKAEQGRFFFDREGKATFWNRSRMQISTTVAASYDGSVIKHATMKYGWGENVFNDVYVMAYPRTLDEGESILWELQEPVKVSPDKPKKISVRYSERNAEQSISAIDPYVFEFTYQGDMDFTTEFLAKSASLIVTNNRPRKNDVLTAIIKGKRLIDYDKVELQESDGTSRTLYGTRELRIDAKMIDDVGFAQNIAEYKIYRHRDPIGEILSIEFLVKNDEAWARILQRNIGDRITISDDQTAHSADYFIMGEEHRPDLHTGYKVIWYLEIADTNTYWLLGTAGFSELGVTTRIGL